MRSRSSGQRPSGLGGSARQLIEQQRRGLGAVADDGVALAHQPLRQAGGGEDPAADGPRRHQALQPASGQEEHGPRGIGGWRGREIARHRLDLRGGRGRRVDGSAKSAAKRVIRVVGAALAVPGGAHHARLEAGFARVAGQRLGVAVGGDDAARAGLPRSSRAVPASRRGPTARIRGRRPAGGARRARASVRRPGASEKRPRRRIHGLPRADSGASTSSPANEAPRGRSTTISAGGITTPAVR